MLRKIAISVFLLLASGPASSGDFKRGDIAFVRGDYETAMRIWMAEANKGNASAQYNLGLMLENGLGVAADFKEAIHWYVLAARQGHGRAQNNLGALYAIGRGTLKDSLRAYMWWKIAVLSGVKTAAQNIRKIENTMSPMQIAKAKEMAYECIVKKSLAGC